MPNVNAGTFAGLIESLDQDPHSRGKQFEKIVKWWLTQDPLRSRDIKKVWLWNEWPGHTGPDIGIDLVAEMLDGSLTAIQAKCFDPARDIPKSELDSFISAASPRRFTHRLLIASTDGLSSNARRALHDNNVVKVMRSDLETSLDVWPTTFSLLGDSTTISKWGPRPHQMKAINDVVAGLKKASRGQLIMACGTGKTLTSLWITEQLDSSSTLVLVPSLSLLSQTLLEWARHSSTTWSYLCVCSDDTVNKSDDQIVSTTADLPFNVTTKPADIAAFLSKRGRKIIFSTYQSSAQVAKGQKKASKNFDLVIADEAHRLTGKNDADFATILDKNKIAAKKLLFMTATPRTYTASVKMKASERGVEITSMDDETVFGKELHKLSFGQAIEQDLLTDYRVVIIGVTDPQVQELIDRRELVTVGGTIDTDARTLAAHIGLAKATKDYDLKRTISFHGRIKAAQQFAQNHASIIAWMPVDQKPSGTIWTGVITGAMNSSDRRKLLDKLKEDVAGQHALLSNARCLTEGVDVPSLDGVAFIDPRSSQVDIIQAVGRAIRKTENKALGTIVLPVLIPSDLDSERGLDESAFKPIWGILNALRSHDDSLVSELAGMRTELGKSGKTSTELTKIFFDLPSDISRLIPDFSNALLLKIIERTTSSWDWRFGILLAYVDEFGSALVRDDVVYKQVNLGKWIGQARRDHKRGDLIHERVQKLENLKDWSWEPYETHWQSCFAKVRDAFEEGRIDLSKPFPVTDSESQELKEWIQRQRNLRNRGWMDEDKVLLMETIEGWSWNPVDQRFRSKLELLREFTSTYGTSRLSKSHPDPKFRDLASWTVTLRMSMKNGTLDQSKIEALESTPHWTWTPFDSLWESMYELLQVFVEREGHSLPLAKHVEDGKKLGSWTSTQRTRYRRKTLPPSQIGLLEKLEGWSWDPIDEWWESSFHLLEKFAIREGHTLVPHGLLEGNENLGSWVLIQRQFCKKGKMPIERTRRLAALPFWNWSPQETRTKSNFEALVTFLNQHKHSDVMGDQEATPSFKRWVKSTRDKYANGALSKSMITQLNSLKGWTWTVETIDHDQLFLDAYMRYISITNELFIRKNQLFEGLDLHSWSKSLRSSFQRGLLNSELRNKIEQIPGWEWDANDQRWNQSYNKLRIFAEVNGHANPSNSNPETSTVAHFASNQRSDWRRGTLSNDRINKMEALPHWTWTPLDDLLPWKKSYERLTSYVNRTGSCKVSKKVDHDGTNLWNWINYQRMRYRRNELNDHQISLLGSIPDWEWNPSQRKKSEHED